MDEAKSVPSPTKPKTKPSEANRNGARSVKSVEEPAPLPHNVTKLSHRPQRTSQPFKACKNVLQPPSSDSGSSSVRAPGTDIPRRTKSNPGNYNIHVVPSLSSSLGQSPVGGHSNVAALGHSGPSSSSSVTPKLLPPAASASQKEQSLSSVTTSSLSSSLSLQPNKSGTGSLSLHDSVSPNLSHKLTSSLGGKKPMLASHISMPTPQPQHLDPPRQRMLDRANKARLYFLRQSGPNKFLIGGDSFDSRFHVNIGPQTCSCNRTNCVHLLFVMLRVLKVKPSSPMLWSKPLRNYEVETLLKDFRDRVNQRTATPRKSKKKFEFLRRSQDSVTSSGSVAGGRGRSGRSTPGNSVDELSPPVSPGGNSEEEEQMEDKVEPLAKLDITTAAVGVCVVEEEAGQEREEPEGGESDKEEDVCPICLNELDEGEDLLVCPGCHNHLHQHCMDVWANEERRKNRGKVVHCPVCRASWPQSSPSAGGSSFGLDTMPVSVPVMTESGKAGGGMALSEDKALLLLSLREVFGNSSSSSRMDALFSSDWRARETALNDISREAISLLLSHSSSSSMGDHSSSSGGVAAETSVVISGCETPPRVKCSRVQEVCMEVVKISCGDSVLKVFLAAMDLMKVVLVYSCCSTVRDCQRLQGLISPVLSHLLTRCADAQKRVKECSLEAAKNLCLGSDGPLSVGSARGQASTHQITDLRFVLQTSLSGQDKNESKNWRWWLGRLCFMETVLNQFSLDYLLSQCLLGPAHNNNGSSISRFGSFSDDEEGEESNWSSGLPSPSDSITSSAAASVTASEFSYDTTEEGELPPPLDDSYLKEEELEKLSNHFLKTSIGVRESRSPPALVGASLADSGLQQHRPKSASPAPPLLPPAVETNLLMQVWFFAAKATHVPQRKLGRVARRVIVRIARILHDDPSSLDVAHLVVDHCHRTYAEGLLDRVLQAREGGGSYSAAIATAEHQGGVASSEEKGEGLLDKKSASRRGPESKRRSANGKEDRKSRLRSPGRSSKSPEGAVATAKSSSLGVATSQGRSLSPASRLSSASPHFSSSPIPSRKLVGGVKTPDGSVEKGGVEGRDGLPSRGGALLSRSSSRGSKISRQKSRSSVKNGGANPDELVESDESFRSALSDFDPDCSSETIILREALNGTREEGEGSSAGSHDSQRSGGREKYRSRDGSSSGGSAGGQPQAMELPGMLPGFPGKLSGHTHLYMRQSTADSVFSTDSTDTDGSGGWGLLACKHNIEQEEAEDLARVRSMEVQDMPHPSLSLAPPTAEVLIHVQASNKKGDETDQASVSKPYLEGTHWVKGKLIGTGAFCSCFLARDMENGTMFAVKQVSFARNTESQEAEELSRLKEEVSMLGRINHPNIVRCLGATQYDTHINIFIEWMAGGCLDQLLHDFGRFGESVICNYTRQIIRGIVFLHERDIIHRDLKGGNILVDSTGQKLRIADFGAAARLATHTTGSGEFQNMEGTVAFMAPEVVKGGTDDRSGYGRKCDVWSIGCVIIQMATAKHPWAGTYDPKVKFQLIFKIGQAAGPPPMPEFVNPALKDFALRCLEVNPKDRPTSAELMRHPLYRLGPKDFQRID